MLSYQNSGTVLVIYVAGGKLCVQQNAADVSAGRFQ